MLAHAGHWLTSLLYGAPVFAIVIVLAIQNVRDRRAGRDPRTPGDYGEPTLDEIMDGH